MNIVVSLILLYALLSGLTGMIVGRLLRDHAAAELAAEQEALPPV